MLEMPIPFLGAEPMVRHTRLPARFSHRKLDPLPRQAPWCMPPGLVGAVLSMM